MESELYQAFQTAVVWVCGIALGGGAVVGLLVAMYRVASERLRAAYAAGGVLAVLIALGGVAAATQSAQKPPTPTDKHVVFAEGLTKVRDNLSATGGDFAWTTQLGNVHFEIDWRATTNDEWQVLVDDLTETHYLFEMPNAQDKYFYVKWVENAKVVGIDLYCVDIDPNGISCKWRSDEVTNWVGRTVHILVKNPNTDGLWYEVGTVEDANAGRVEGWFMDHYNDVKVYMDGGTAE